MNILISGGAGFIGSNLAERLLKDGHTVKVLDNLSTGNYANIKEFETNERFEFIQGDIRNIEDCRNACKDIDIISHQAALGSVPRSINDPIATNDVNISGFLNMLVAGKENKVQRFVYAASSSTYGDSAELPKIEERIGKPLSPYAVTKFVNELYADVFHRIYGIDCIGLRYFNVFGPKQDPNGAYAAVIPLFIKCAASGKSPVINGDGLQTRDFTYIDNVIQANLKAFQVTTHEALNQVYNVAVGESTSLNQLWKYISEISRTNVDAIHGPDRTGDIRNSLADISKAEKLLGYRPEITIKPGLERTYRWFQSQASLISA